MSVACTVTCHGYLEAEQLPNVDLEDLARRILAGEIGRPEFFVEIRDDTTLLGTVHTGPLYPLDADTPADRWCVTFAEPNENGRWCLAAATTSETYDWYLFCGGETEILGSCAVPLAAVLETVRKCCQEGGRARSVRWIDMGQAMNL